MSIQRSIVANYSETEVNFTLDTNGETLVSNAALVRIRSKNGKDRTIIVREAATNNSFTLEWGEVSQLLDGSKGIYVTKDILEERLQLSITEYSLTGYSEVGTGNAISKIDTYHIN